MIFDIFFEPFSFFLYLCFCCEAHWVLEMHYTRLIYYYYYFRPTVKTTWSRSKID